LDEHWPLTLSINLQLLYQSGTNADHPQRFSDAKVARRSISNWMAGRRTGMPAKLLAGNFRVRKAQRIIGLIEKTCLTMRELKL